MVPKVYIDLVNLMAKGYSWREWSVLQKSVQKSVQKSMHQSVHQSSR